MFLALLPFLLYRDPVDNLPFEDPSDEQSERRTPAPVPLTFSQVILQRPLTSVFGLREIIALGLLATYITWYILGRRDIRRVEASVVSRVQNALKKYFAVVVERFVRSESHRIDAFSTGRTGHKGVLTTVHLTRRCDPIGYLWDLLRGAKSVLSLEFLVDVKNKCPMMLHVGQRAPAFAEKLRLQAYDTSEPSLTCYTDLGEERQVFMSLIDGFLEKNKGMVKFVEVTDVNRFDLMSECNTVVKVVVEFTGETEGDALSQEVVDWAMSIADKYSTIEFDDAVVRRMMDQRSFLSQEKKT